MAACNFDAIAVVAACIFLFLPIFRCCLVYTVRKKRDLEKNRTETNMKT